MKLSNSTFLITSAIEKVLEKYHANRKKRDELAAKVPEWERQRNDLLKNGGVEDEQKFASARTLDDKIRFTPGSLRQFDEAAELIEQDMDHECECLKRGMGHAERQFVEEVLKSIDRAIQPYLNDKDVREAYAREIYSRSVQGWDADVYTTSGRYTTGDVLTSAERAISDAEKLQAAIRKHASLLPKDFNPFPKTEAEFLALCPPRRVKAEPSAAPEISGEERFEQTKRLQAVADFRRARSNGDDREADRIWHDFMHHTDRAQVALEECGEPLTLLEVDAVLRLNGGCHFTEALKAVRLAAGESAAALEKQTVATVEE
jgi:hypothetical protein